MERHNASHYDDLDRPTLNHYLPRRRRHLYRYCSVRTFERHEMAYVNENMTSPRPSPFRDNSSLSELLGAPAWQNVDAFIGAPWFCPQAVLRLGEIREEYCDGNGFLPGNLPFTAVKRPDWLSQNVVPNEAKKCCPYENVRASQRRFF